jgi:hypothetical protein
MRSEPLVVVGDSFDGIVDPRARFVIDNRRNLWAHQRVVARTKRVIQA